MPNPTSPKCRHCVKPSPYAELCSKCVRTFRVGLRNVAALFADLDTTARSGMSRFTESSPISGRSVEVRLPFDARFANRYDKSGQLVAGRGSELDHEVRNTLGTWCRAVADDYPPIVLPKPPAIVCTAVDCPRCVPVVEPELQRLHDRRRPPINTVTSMAVYLFRMAGSIATEAYADELMRDVLGLERRLRHFVDRPGDAWYAGLCGSILEPERPHDVFSCGCQCHHGLGVACDVPGGCGREYATIDAVLCARPLWAQAEDSYVRCRDCSTTWAVDDRREILLAEASERVATVEAIWRIVHSLVDDQIGYTQFSARVRQWKHRGQIYDHGSRVVDGEPRRVYLVADVLALLSATAPTVAS